MNRIAPLANVIYHEARGESRRGQIAVGYVVLNRVKSSRYPNTISGVVWQPKQFSRLKRHKVPQKFLRLAEDILAGRCENPIGNCMSFRQAGRS